MNPASSILIFPFVISANFSATCDEPVNYNNYIFNLLINFSIFIPSVCIKSMSLNGKPHTCNNLINYSITTLTRESPFNNTLLPGINAPINYNTGISNGKLNGHIIHTGPYGNLYPFDY